MSGTAPVLTPGEPPRIGRFRIASTIGSGGSGTVYLAMDTREGAWRALKVLAFDRLRDERARTRFTRECESALAVKHPHLAQAFDADPADPYSPWLALEVCEGGTLADWISRHGPMPAYLAIEVMVQVCSGLAAGHRAGVAQRRVGAADVLLDRRGKCKLVDFRPAPGGAAGLGSDSVDLRNDVVAAGGLLHELLTGRPYKAGIPMGGVPDALQQVVARSQQRGRGQGYPDAAAMGRELEAAMLEVSLPTGTVAPLVEGDVALPDSVEALFDASATFPELERSAAFAADPEAGPSKVQRDTEAMFKLLNSGAAPRREPRTLPPTARPPRAKRVEGPDGGVLFRTPAPAPYGRVTGSGFAATRSPSPPHRRGSDASPAPAQRKDGLTPDYVVEEANVEREERWRQATPAPVQRVTKPEPPPVDPRLVAVGVVLLVLMVLGTFGYGAYGVRNARISADAAAEALTAIVEAEGAVVNELVGRGASREVLEGRFFAYKDARGDQRYDAALAFVDAVLSEAAVAGVDLTVPTVNASDTARRVAAMQDARSRYLREVDAWRSTADGFPGVLAVTLGLANRPD